MTKNNIRTDYCEICKMEIPDELLDKIEIKMDSKGEIEFFCPIHGGYWKLQEEQKKVLMQNIFTRHDIFF